MAGTDLYPVAGSKIYIGGALSTKTTDFVAADFTAQSWTLIDGWSTMGSIGDTRTIIKTDLINRNRTTKQGGTADAGSMANEFAKIDADAGQIAVIAAQAANANFAFKIEFDDAPVAESHAVTVTIAAPGVFSWTAHGLEANDTVKLATTGTLPSGLTAGTTYYVVPIDADSFSLSATSGGSAITTTGSQTGTHTITTVGSPSQRLFVALVTSASEKGGTANTVQNMSVTLEINSNVVAVAAAA
jgi:hypothetical protein